MNREQYDDFNFTRSGPFGVSRGLGEIGTSRERHKGVDYGRVLLHPARNNRESCPESSPRDYLGSNVHPAKGGNVSYWLDSRSRRRGYALSSETDPAHSGGNSPFNCPRVGSSIRANRPKSNVPNL